MMMTEFIQANAGTPETLVNNIPEPGATLSHPRAPRLRFRTAADIANDTPQRVPWIVEGWVAEGSITELDGKVKLAGKTTFLLAMSRKVLDGHLFMGFATAKTPVVFLTEQPLSSFREALRRADLLGRDDFIVLTHQESAGTRWHRIVEAAARECHTRDAKLLVVDTLPQFAGLRGDTENQSGAALEVLEPVQKLAANGIGVVLSRHERKSGGDVGDSGRGSSAWDGVVDIIVSIRRGEGTAPTVRVLRSVSRFDETPSQLVINLHDGEYHAEGTEARVALKDAMRALIEKSPVTQPDAKPTNELITLAGMKSTVGKEAINELHDQGILARIGEGKSGNPYKYWMPLTTPAGSDQNAGSDLEQVEASAISRSQPTDVVASDQHPAEEPSGEVAPGGASDDVGVVPESRSDGNQTPTGDHPTDADVEEGEL